MRFKAPSDQVRPAGRRSAKLTACERLQSRPAEGSLAGSVMSCALPALMCGGSQLADLRLSYNEPQFQSWKLRAALGVIRWIRRPSPGRFPKKGGRRGLGSGCAWPIGCTNRNTSSRSETAGRASAHGPRRSQGRGWRASRWARPSLECPLPALPAGRRERSRRSDSWLSVGGPRVNGSAGRRRARRAAVGDLTPFKAKARHRGLRMQGMRLQPGNLWAPPPWRLRALASLPVALPPWRSTPPIRRAIIFM
jgi:hypothetical protein